MLHQPATPLLPTIRFHTIPVLSTLLSENLLISYGWSWIEALSSSSCITSHVSCQGNHLTESTIKNTHQIWLLFFFFCLDKSHLNALLHQRKKMPIFFSPIMIWFLLIQSESNLYLQWGMKEESLTSHSCES